MNAKECDELRKLQDRFIKHPHVVRWVKKHSKQTLFYINSTFPTTIIELEKHLAPSYQEAIYNLLFVWDNQEKAGTR